MKKPNAYLQKQEMCNQALLDVGMDTGSNCGWNPAVSAARLAAIKGAVTE